MIPGGGTNNHVSIRNPHRRSSARGRDLVRDSRSPQGQSGTALTMSAGHGRVVRFSNRSKATVVGDKIVVADTSWSRLIGLLGQTGLAPGEGLWIFPSQGVHTIGMRFAIDVAFLDGRMRVIYVKPEMRPYRLSPVNFKATSVLELPAGALTESHTVVNDELEVEAVVE